MHTYLWHRHLLYFHLKIGAFILDHASYALAGDLECLASIVITHDDLGCSKRTEQELEGLLEGRRTSSYPISETSFMNLSTNPGHIQVSKGGVTIDWGRLTSQG